MAALESKCVFMCMRIAMTVPEKEMMYAKLDCVFLDTPSLDLSWQPCAQPLILSPAKRIVGGRRNSK